MINTFLKKYTIVFFLAISLQAIAEMTQTDAFLSLPENKALVDKWYNMNTNPFFKMMYEKTNALEKKYLKNYYVFYSGYNSEWRLPQDLYLKLLAKLRPLTVSLSNYRAFRWMPEKYQTSKQFLKKEFLEHGIVDDIQVRLKAFLVSANLALFGNVNRTDECTFEYFLNPSSHATVSDWFIQTVLDVFDNPESYKQGQTPMLYKYVPRILELQKYFKGEPLKTAEGKIYETPQTLSQIFVDKSIVDDVAYLSWIQGMPFEKELADWMKQATSGKQRKRYTEFVADVGKLFKEEQFKNPLFKKIFDNIKSGAYSISKALDQYRNNPASVPNLKNLEARLLIFAEYMDINKFKIFDYDRIPKSNKQKYEQELDKIVANIVSDILDKASKIKPTPAAPPDPGIAKGSSNASINALSNALSAVNAVVTNVISNAATYQKSSQLKDKMLGAVASSNTTLLLQYAAAKMSLKDVIAPNDIPLAFVAVGTGKPEVIDRIVNNDVNINAGYKGSSNVTVYPIDYAVWKKQPAVVQALIKNGATVRPQTTSLAKSLGVALK